MKKISLLAVLVAFAVPGMAAEALLTCDKNHYILSEPCAVKATDVAIGAPSGLAFNAARDIFFSTQSVVFRVDADGNLSRVAGTGVAGLAGDGGPATAALLNFPAVYPELEADPIDFWEFAAGLAFDAKDNLYIADSYNDRVRRVEASDGSISTYLGGAARLSRELDWPPLYWGIQWPQGLAFDSKGRLYVSGGSLVRIPREEGPVDLVASWPKLQVAEGLAIDADDNVVVAEALCTIKKVSPEGAISVVVASPRCWAFSYLWGGKGEGLAWPYGVAVDAEGNVLIADTYNHCIRRKTVGGALESVAGNCGPGGAGFSGDGGPSTSARLNAPKGIAVDREGNVFIADTGNNRVRRIGPDGIIYTIAGNGEPLRVQDQR